MKYLKLAAVFAVISLGVGAATATAGSLITSAKIKNGTIKLVDLSPSAKHALKGNTGPRGATGTSGVQGLQGSKGVQGVQGGKGVAGGFDPAKVRYVEGPAVTVFPGPENSDVSVAKCPGGTKVIGGGYFFGYANGGITVEISAPLNDGSGWAAGFGNAGSVEGEATAYAVCAAR